MSCWIKLILSIPKRPVATRSGSAKCLIFQPIQAERLRKQMFRPIFLKLFQ